MVTIKQVLYAGGACPYQIEAITDDGKFFYLRYRSGTLRFGVWENEESFDITNYMFVKTIGDRYEGWGDHDLISKELEGLVTFPDGFVHRSFEGSDNYQAEGVFDGTTSTENSKWVEEKLRELFGEDSTGPRNPIIPS